VNLLIDALQKVSRPVSSKHSGQEAFDAALYLRFGITTSTRRAYVASRIKPAVVGCDKQETPRVGTPRASTNASPTPDGLAWLRKQR
jgi:hypothetical protein